MPGARRKPRPSPAIDARAPHVATEAVVERQGEESARVLYAAFAEYNARFFEGKLGSPLILITQAQSLRTLGDYVARDVLGLESRIRISPKAVNLGDRFAADVLLHEMIHAWQHEIDHDSEPGYRGHGPKFARECNRITATLYPSVPAPAGAEVILVSPVGVKRREGLPDCAHWPMSVRPPGYYPKPFKTPRRKPEQTPVDALQRVLSLLPRLDAPALEKLTAAVSRERAARVAG